MKSNSVMTRSIVGTVIAWLFKDGKTVSIDVATLTPEIREYAAIHGISQKVADAAAMSVVDGKPASVADKRGAMEKVVATLVAGNWTGPREGGDNAGLLFQALCVVYPKKTPEAIRKYLNGDDSTTPPKPALTAAQKAAVAETKRVKTAIDHIRAERVKTAGVDVAPLVAELEAIGE